jgi:putative NIF3 family GTP cyclohydrolase 1 type 2
MRLADIYKKIIQYGADRDPRKDASRIKFPDTALLWGDPDTQVHKVLVGIDVEGPELLLADRIRQREVLDLVIAHHPEGVAFANLHEVMRLQVDVLLRVGLPKEVAEGLMNERIAEVGRRLLPNNHMRAVDTARLLDMPFMCCHTPADNQVACFIEQLMYSAKPKTVQDVVDILSEVPEYREAAKLTLGPRVILGSPRRPAGQVFVEMTGGTEGSKDVYDKLYRYGVRTIIAMHLSDEHFKKVKAANLNVVIAGHISSDVLGLNLLFDRIEKEERLTWLECSGFYRIRR